MVPLMMSATPHDYELEAALSQVIIGRASGLDGIEPDSTAFWHRRVQGQCEHAEVEWLRSCLRHLEPREHPEGVVLT